MELVPVGALAQLLCITERRVQQLAKEGIIPKAERGQYKLIPSVQGYIRYLQEESRQGVGGSPEMADSKTRLARTKADTAEIKLLEMRKELVRTRFVLDAWVDVLTTFKTRMRSIPSKVAPRARMAKTDGQAEEIIRKEIDKGLDELSRADIKIKPPSDGGSEPQGAD